MPYRPDDGLPTLEEAPEKVLMEESAPQQPAIPPTRLVALGDGVFAIVMTLLVFQLTVPVVTDDEALARALVDMWPDFAVYVLSFAVLGVFWLIHHVLFDVVERYDTSLIWLNVTYLMLAALIPFSTNLVATYRATTTTATVYGLNMMAVFGLGWAIFGYATHRRRLVTPELDPDVVRGGNLMGVAYMAYMAVGITMALLSPVGSFLLYGLMVLTIVATTMVGKGEVVLLWRSRPAGGSDAEATTHGDQLVSS